MTIPKVTCSIMGCSYSPDGGAWESPEECTTYQARAAEVRNHLDMDHFNDFGDRNNRKEPKPEVGEKSKEKVDTKLERPSLKAAVSENGRKGLYLWVLN